MKIKIVGIILIIVGIIGFILGAMMFGDIGVSCSVAALVSLISGIGFISIDKKMNSNQQ